MLQESSTKSIKKQEPHAKLLVVINGITNNIVSHLHISTKPNQALQTQSSLTWVGIEPVTYGGLAH